MPDVSPMFVYRILFDSQFYVVAARSFDSAIKQWKVHVKEKWGEDYDGTEQPESVERIDGEFVHIWNA